MRNTANHLIDLGLSCVGRRPVLTALIVYSVAFGAAALIVAFAESRDTTCNPNPKTPDPVYMALATSGGIPPTLVYRV
jgi:hypothetical protein